LIPVNTILCLLANTALSSNLVAQGIGMGGLIFAIFSFQNNKRNLILFFLGMAQMFFIFHFALLGVWTAAAMNVVGSTRTFFFIFRGRKKWMESNAVMFIFIFLFLISCVFSWQNWLSILPIAAMIIETIGLWQKNPRIIRFIVFVPHPVWFVYNFIHRSYPGVLAEVFILVSLITGIVRFDILPWLRKRNDSGKENGNSPGKS
jgi:hypothetical protein